MDLLTYRKMLAELAREMGKRELETMKFMCSDHIPRGYSEEIETVLRFWQALEERSKLSPEDTDYLRFLLENCTEKRTDLLNILDNYCHHGHGQGATVVTSVSSKKVTQAIPPDVQDAFDLIVKDVGRNWKGLARKLGLSEADIDCCVEKYPKELREQIREALNVWAGKKESVVTLEALCTALRKSQLVQLAEIIEKNTNS